MVRHVEIEPEQMRRRWRRMWLAAIIGFLLLLLLLAIVVIWRMARLTPELPASIYLDDRINGVAIVRLDTADKGLTPILSRWVGTRLGPDGAAKALSSVEALAYPRIRAFARGGDTNVYSTHVLVVAHIKRFAYLLQRALEPALNRKDVKPTEKVDGVSVYPLTFGGWFASTGRALIASNDLGWTTETISVQNRAAKAMAEGVQPSLSARELPDFVRRCAALDTQHEFAGLMLVTPPRRRAVESLMKDVLLERLSASERRKIQPLIAGCMVDVDVLGVELDLQPSNRAVLDATFELETPQGAEAFATRVDDLNRAITRAVAGLKTGIDKPVIEGGQKAHVRIHLNDVQAALDVLLKG
jgi:hypothetical protein